MNEQEQISQLSALFDGELPTQQAELVIRRALKDSGMRGHWQRYALIGACLRGEPLAGANKRGGVAERVSARLAAEAEILAPSRAFALARSVRGRAVGSLFGRGAMGGAIAAAVAVVAVFVVRSIGPADGDGAVIMAESGSPAVVSAPESAAAAESVAGSQARDTAPRLYTTPAENSRAPNPLVEQQPLAHYVVAHSEQAAASLGFSYDLTQGAVDMTEEEIRAHRQ